MDRWDVNDGYHAIGVAYTVLLVALKFAAYYTELFTVRLVSGFQFGKARSSGEHKPILRLSVWQEILLPERQSRASEIFRERACTCVFVCMSMFSMELEYSIADYRPRSGLNDNLIVHCFRYYSSKPADEELVPDSRVHAAGSKIMLRAGKNFDMGQL